MDAGLESLPTPEAIASMTDFGEIVAVQRRAHLIATEGAERRFRAMREIGKLLTEAPELSPIVGRRDARVCMAIATLPEPLFKTIVVCAKVTGADLTTDVLLRAVRQQRRRERDLSDNLREV